MQYLLSDRRPAGLELSPARYAAVDSFANIPWQMKAIYGMVSDLVPIRGLHRAPYIAGAALVGTAAFGALALVRAGTAGTHAIAALLFCANLSMASPDVMIDASMAARTSAHAHAAPDLQALAWGSLSVCSLLGSLVKGRLLATRGTRALLATGVGTSAMLLAPAWLGWLGERRRDDGDRAPCCGRAAREAARAVCSDPARASVLKLSVGVCVLSFATGGLSMGTDSATAIWAGGACVTAFVCAAILHFERAVSMTLAKASVYIFLSGALQPSTPVMFFWYRESAASCTAEGEASWRAAPPPVPRAGGLGARLFADVHNEHARPCFDPEFLGWMSVVGYASFALGTMLYHRSFTRWSYRRIWQGTQCAFVLLNLLDYVWVSRWNLALGVPDTAFMLGEEVLAPVFSRLSAMPMFILAARLCPPGIEGTLFALTMGLSNFGGKMGSVLAIGLLDALGGVDAPTFTNLRLLVVIRALTRALPLLLIPFLVPTGSPSDIDLVAEPGGGAVAPDGVAKLRAAAGKGGSSASAHGAAESADGVAAGGATAAVGRTMV